jgi:hypothetical protein
MGKSRVELVDCSCVEIETEVKEQGHVWFSRKEQKRFVPSCGHCGAHDTVPASR